MHHPAPDDQPWIRDARRAIGTRISDIRRWRNLTQEELVELTGISRSTLQNIEAGSNDVRISHLLRIARALRTTLIDLLVDGPLPPPD